ncbi:helix-turn-helix transcriptional regulator [Levilactobacillus zymae]|uniref:HTH cro/C1-type domain-containing protein n=1 Tax=Levilactobacillus zymae TaxID=267363 RepID=A0A1Y6JTZ6_9LACO|nr:helix-turn-helix transcriptional regulator [Levilactobacillus zymae]SMS13426.1 hypothetical protein LZ3411_0376 [Levilactobacillus zymae]
MELPRQLTQIRQFRGYSVAQLAEKLRVPPTLVTTWEAGIHYPSLQAILGLSRILNVPVRRLVQADLGRMRQELRGKNPHRDTDLLLALSLFFGFSWVPVLLVWRHWPWVLGVPLSLWLGVMGLVWHLDGRAHRSDRQHYREILGYFAGQDVATLWQQRLRHRERWVVAGSYALLLVVLGVLGGLMVNQQ